MIRKGQAFAVRFVKLPLKPLLLEVLACQRNRRVRQVDTGDDGAAPRETRQVGPGTATDLQDTFTPVALEVHEAQQVVQLFEMILIEILKEARAANRMVRDFEIVNVPVPVRANIGGRGSRHESVL